MKRLIAICSVLVLFGMLMACDGRPGDWLEYPSHYGRAGNQTFDSYPNITILENSEELQGFSSSSSMAKRFDKAFFEGNTLIIVTFEEGGGSLRHEMMGITTDNEGVSYCIVIKRLLPYETTCDVARWQFILEVPKDSPVLWPEVDLSVRFEDEHID